MESGRLILQDGATASCSYEFATNTNGFLDLGSMFMPLRESTTGTLELSTGERRQVTVTFGSRVGQASFVCD
jgi:hypothetical protein